MACALSNFYRKSTRAASSLAGFAGAGCTPFFFRFVAPPRFERLVFFFRSVGPLDRPFLYPFPRSLLLRSLVTRCLKNLAAAESLVVCPKTSLESSGFGFRPKIACGQLNLENFSL